MLCWMLKSYSEFSNLITPLFCSYRVQMRVINEKYALVMYMIGRYGIMSYFSFCLACISLTLTFIFEITYIYLDVKNG